MSRQIIFKSKGWGDYLYWQSQDRKTLRKINQLLADIDRNGHQGLGQPEPLKHDLQGWWSRRIDGVNRLVYRIDGNELQIMSCRSHYGD